MSFGNVKGAVTHAKGSRTLSPTSAAQPSTNSLRILLVDDNQINLSVLSTLLKRRFGHVLASSPVALDSGLKALQLLRTEVFDLVFMDIEMPYLDGVECARRIRAGEDGVLEANRDAHIVAVTTNIGDEPEALYRSVGMDGMIGKPVRFDQFQQYLCPLAIQAQEARTTIAPVWIGDKDVMPPLPPVGARPRLFFKPSVVPGAPIPKMSRLDSQEGVLGDSFAEMLKAQTRASLRDRRAMFLARTGTVTEPRRSSFNERREQLARQTIREIATSPERNELTFQALIDQEAMAPHSSASSASGRSCSFNARPAVYHRFSSPAYLLDASPVAKLKTDPAARSTPNLVRTTRSPTRPGIRPLVGSTSSKSQSRQSDEASPYSSETSSRLGGSSLFSGLSQLRRLSDDGTASSSLTTPQSSPRETERFFSPEELGDAVFSPCEDDLHSVFLRVPSSDLDLLPLKHRRDELILGSENAGVDSADAAAAAAINRLALVEAKGHGMPCSMADPRSPVPTTCASW
ncbi:uncharacterized protein PFL1_03776 [Pseudozyma flocculosa PF-1]|uniref:Response regulatory domain-containing protein n=2 Tax=Pseudozyma flocculosa TaxID=84751 RepID=A0A5C3EZI1_9BASI|nr:uncharacterized protein PFL1_03776 [Pseudozyma flocculosa PF-1]EPQ28473.1 hypothetical protein PFL1_03776 [Pseudozyma flocculosa PF-1]SPO36391.1 uncharacterized protein PSFLO_01862 [Pseudozyma flocculosa]